MGVTGTEVAKEAADMVLTDDNFASIVTAVGEGRRIYDNIRRFVRYTLTSNAGEIWVMFLGPFIGLPLPLQPVQILWINLVTDGFPGLALGIEPAEPTSWSASHGPRREHLRPRRVAASDLHRPADGFPHSRRRPVGRGDRTPWQTMIFTHWPCLQLGNAFALRSERQSFFTQESCTNKPLLWTVW